MILVNSQTGLNSLSISESVIPGSKLGPGVSRFEPKAPGLGGLCGTKVPPDDNDGCEVKPCRHG